MALGFHIGTRFYKKLFLNAHALATADSGYGPELRWRLFFITLIYIDRRVGQVY
jgi:hypothetical protein